MDLICDRCGKSSKYTSEHTAHVDTCGPRAAGHSPQNTGQMPPQDALAILNSVSYVLTNRLIDGPWDLYPDGRKAYGRFTIILVAKREELAMVKLFHCIPAYFGGRDQYRTAARPVRQMVTLRYISVCQRWRGGIEDSCYRRRRLMLQGVFRGTVKWFVDDWFVLEEGQLDAFWAIYCAHQHRM